VLEVGKAGTAGTEKGVVPILRDGAVVATLRSSAWKEAATATIGAREWVFARAEGVLTGRWAVDPDGVTRLTARQTSSWKSTWGLDLEGIPVEMTTASTWKGTHRYSTGGSTVAESGSTGGWSPRPTLSAGAELPLHHQVFMLWLEVVISRRNTAVIAGAVGVAVIGGSS
jgi:hypothetical protein